MPGTEQNNKRDMMNARIAGGNVETIEFDKVNNGGRTPVPPVPPVPPAPSTAHQDMYKAVTKAPLSEADEQAKRKKQRKQSTLAAIIDGLSALGNVYFATRGANATGTTNLSQGVSGKWKDYWDQVRKDRDDYNKGLLAAKQMDYNADVRKLERAEDKAERDAVRAQQQSNWETTRQDGLMKDAQQQSNWQKIFDANDKQRGIQNARADKEFDEGKIRYGIDDVYRKQVHKDTMKLQEDAKARRLRGRDIVFTDKEGRKVSVYENVWKGSMQAVYDAIVEDLAPTNAAEKRRYESRMEDLDTAQKKDDFVKQNWYKSKRAKDLMAKLAQDDPYLNPTDDVVDYTPGGSEEIIEYTPNK